MNILQSLKAALGKLRSYAFKVTSPDQYSKNCVRKSDPVGIVVGHNATKQGAVNYLGESEWEFNKRIAEKLQLKLRDMEVSSTIFHRPSNGGYSYECDFIAGALQLAGCKYSIHLHFNSSGSKKARGCEVLVPVNCEDISIAESITESLKNIFKFRLRHGDGILPVLPGHNGWTMLRKVRAKGVFPAIVEPCFGNYRNNESAKIFENEDSYVELLAEAISKVVL